MEYYYALNLFSKLSTYLEEGVKIGLDGLFKRVWRAVLLCWLDALAAVNMIDEPRMLVFWVLLENIWNKIYQWYMPWAIYISSIVAIVSIVSIKD